MEELKNWLSDKAADYQLGVTIYNQHKRNHKFDAFFSQVRTSKPGDVHFEMLREQLLRINRLMQAYPDVASKANQPIRVEHQRAKPIALDKIPAKKQAQKDHIHITDNPFVDISLLPPDLQKLYTRNKDTYKTMVELYSKMKQATDDDSRKQLLEELTELQSERKANWQAIDSYVEARKLTDPAVKLKQIKAQQRAELLGRYIRRTTRELETVKTAQKKLEKQAKIDQWQSELDTINATLHAYPVD